MKKKYFLHDFLIVRQQFWVYNEDRVFEPKSKVQNHASKQNQ